jgi:hypothetical protein
MDRQDGDDMGTFGSPAAAIRVAATRLEAMIWNTNGLPPTEPKETDKDIQEIVVRRIEEHRFSSGYFGAAFRTGTIGRGVGDTPSISLRALATLLEINAVKYYWYAAFLGHK